MLHLTADSLHESLQLGESVGSLQPQLTLRQIVVGLVLQQLQSLPDMKVWLLESSPAMTTQFYQVGGAGQGGPSQSPELLGGDLARLPLPLGGLEDRHVELEM